VLRINIAFIVEAIDAREIEVHYIASAEQAADMLTAAEDRARFERNRDLLLGHGN
jgi:hypothetical protein